VVGKPPSMTVEAADYVVVGAGSAGCVLANRLSADPDTTVLVLEAGGPADKREIAIPAAASTLFGTDVDWDYATEPQPALDDRRIDWPRGKVLGGTSAINYQIYIRGHPTDYDRWAAAGNDGWDYESVLPAFKRSEHNTRGAGPTHGADGPLWVTDLESHHPLSERFVAAGQEQGLAYTPDFNAGDPHGVGYFQVTQRDGARHSVADAYLDPVRDRPNLTVETHALATDLAGDGATVTGVTYRQDGRTHTVRAREEVLVCAGAVNSPQLLLVSGFGPPEQLRTHDIPVRRALPGVGRHLQDHVVAAVSFETTDPIAMNDAPTRWDTLRYLLFSSGRLTSNGAEAGAFLSVADGEVPDIQLIFLPMLLDEAGVTDRPDRHGYTVAAVLLHPESRGRITLQSADPTADPVIDPRYLTADRDRETLIAGLRRARAIGAADAFADVRAGEAVPGPAVRTDAEWAAALPRLATTIWHPVGTCRMGDGDSAVVDDRLRVHGVEGLRVVDASVMPTIVSGNTNAPTVMIAEQAAADITRDWA